MNSSFAATVGRAIRAARELHTETDRDLLRRFARENDQSAFEILVKRHGSMVLGVCRRSLPTVQDAEDAAQAAFLVLAKRARDGKWQESLANWLYLTARRVARNARVAHDRRTRREKSAASRESREQGSLKSGCELVAALDSALEGLAESYREPLVLCYLEGLSREEAAGQLGIPLATLHTRIERGRKQLHNVLTSEGYSLGAGLLALAASSAVEAVSPRLASAILASLPGFASGFAASSLTSIAIILAAVTATLGLAAGSNTQGQGSPSQPAKSAVAPLAAVEKERIPLREDNHERQFDVKGKVLGPDGKPVAGARLFLLAEKLLPAPQALANEDGSFALKLRRDHDNTLVVSAPGFGFAHGILSHRRPTITVHLQAEEIIAGQVLNQKGQPVEGVPITLSGMYRNEDGKLIEWLKGTDRQASRDMGGNQPLRDDLGWLAAAGIVSSAVSGRDGKFTIRGVGRDSLAVLRLTHPSFATQEALVFGRKIEVFTSKRFFEVEETIHGSEPALVVAPVPVTRGQVLDDATGKPIAGAVLWVDNLVQRGERIMGVHAVAGKDGQFTLPGLPLDHWALCVNVASPEGAPYHSVRLKIPNDAQDRAAFNLRLTRGIPATVKVIDQATGKPVKAALLYRVFLDNPNVKQVPDLFPFPAFAGPSYSAELKTVVFRGKGLVAIQAVNPGEYLTGVGVDAFQRYRKEDVIEGLAGRVGLHCNSFNTYAEIDVPADAQEFTTTIALDRGVTAVGCVCGPDGRPLTGAESFGLKNTHVRGEFWDGPTSYAAFTACALKLGEKRRVMFVHATRKLAGSAVVVGGAREPVEVRMEPWGEVTGRLVDRDGTPVKGSLHLSSDVVYPGDLALGSSPHCYPHGGDVQSDDDGKFHIAGLVPGLKYRWFAEGTRRPRQRMQDVLVESNRTIDLGDVVLKTSGEQ